MSIGVALLLFGLHLAVVAGFGQFFRFENGMNQTCEASPENEWTVDGSVKLTPGDTVLFQDKVVINRVQELCTVDLTRCPPDPLPTSPQVCYCKSRIDNQYHIHVASTPTSSQTDITLQASVQGRGWFQNIYAASTIGILPGMTENTFRVNASYTIDTLDRREERELLATQNVSVCPDKQIFSVICVDNGHHEAELRLTVDGKTTEVTGGNCVATSHKLTSGQAGLMTFEYKAPQGCTQRSIIHLEEDIFACPIPKSTAESKTVDGVCPDTPRTVITLPTLNNTEVLTDETSMDKSWIIFQRRVSGNVSFNRTWADYETGFGELTDSFWLGLEKVHQLCNKHHKCELLINLQLNGDPEKRIPRRPDGCYHARYNLFWLAGAADKYRLTIGEYTGTAGDDMSDLNENDFFTGTQYGIWSGSNSCVVSAFSGWWPDVCSYSNLNGIWLFRDYHTGVHWSSLSGFNGLNTGYSSFLSFTEMKVRPK